MRSLLLYNPVAGRRRRQRLQVVQGVATILQANGFDIAIQATTAKGSAQTQAHDAVQLGVEAVFACGGDGTVHDVLQGVAGTDAALGVIPAGSANALAQELGLSRDPTGAARLLFPGQVRRIPLSALVREEQTPRYFLCMASAGPSGALMYRMMHTSRNRFGRFRYYEQAWRSFLTAQFPTFTVEILTEQGRIHHADVVSAMALRIGNLGGLFRGMARGAALDNALHICLLSPPAVITLPLWFIASWLGLKRLHPGIQTFRAVEMRLRTAGIPMQIDGEWVGVTPARFALLHQDQKVLVPKGS